MNSFFKGSLFFIILFFACWTFDARGQSSFTLKEADRFYKNYHYASAIPLYESWLSKAPDDTLVIEKLADSYSKVNDSRNEELWYNRLITAKPADKNGVLKYASALAKNGKYGQSQKYFTLFRELGGDTRGLRYVEAFQNLSKLHKDSSNITIKPLIVNSRQDDFSPAFYQNGILFCSDRVSEQKVKNTFDWNHSAYLDIYHLLDTSDVSHAIEKSTASRKQRKRLVTSGTHSDHTYQTSNDTRTLGYLNRPVHNDSLQLEGTRIVKFNAINTKYHEGPLVFFKGEDSLIFTRNNYYKGKYKTDDKGTNKLKLFTASKEADSWSVKEFPYNSDHYSVGHPALSPDNKILFFTSDMPGGKGGTDIWYCKSSGNGWTKPENLTVANTEGQEMFPFIDQQGNLYFASDGWGGLGGLDILYSRNSSQGFETPRNVGFPINSSKDDFGIIVTHDGKTGYFSSARNWDQTLDDIYYFKSKTTLVKSYSIEGVAKEDLTNFVLAETTINLFNEKDEQIASKKTGDDGSFIFSVEPNQNYYLKAIKDNYFPFTKSISTVGLEPGEPTRADAVLSKKGLYSISSVITDSKTNEILDSVKYELQDEKSKYVIVESTAFKKGTFLIALPNVKKGDMFDLLFNVSAKGYLSKTVRYKAFFNEPGELKLQQVMDLKLEKIDLGADIGKLLKVNPIYFNLGKSDIRPDAAKELDKIVAVMIQNPGMKIELGSHTDARGSDASNLALSDKRAKASASYIIYKGISFDRIVGKGYGESKLVNGCVNNVKCPEIEHQLNRRTEFIVTSISD